MAKPASGLIRRGRAGAAEGTTRDDSVTNSTCRKRKYTERNQIWHFPLRKENFRTHQEKQHPLFWKKVRVILQLNKERCFDNFNGVRIVSYFGSEEKGLLIYSNATILERESAVLCGLFFRVVEGDDGLEERSKKRALHVFNKKS
eukprot:Plantae.Rhodophyta-Palmaria_palmata.ctg15681.p1 GENE.Plantae.Rhodophyta-Palmaria_palmata.ctg15681~~Plantae.Rhodophyta-Palmaria_palmata.ctg15681.p1  ORF type:complete len:145 (+),score=16.05 Plantae.Rhodophyta-Palmaria_palmata.ctg15681:66-500(+)